MTAPSSLSSETPSETKPGQHQAAGRMLRQALPGAELFNNLKIGYKLVVGFGVLVLLILLVGSFSYLSSRSAINNINETITLRAPVAFASADAQADLLVMLSDVRGYLALGDDRFRRQYEISRDNFASDLDELNRLRDRLQPENQERLDHLEALFKDWVEWPNPLFDLRNDRLAREAAYKMLATDGVRFGGQVLIDTQTLIELQANQPPSPQSLQLLSDMATFQGSFAAMLSGMRNYVTTRNQNFRGEYESNLVLNNIDWQDLKEGIARSNASAAVDEERQVLLDNIAQNRTAFLALEEPIFEALESKTWRRDLYLFDTEARPLADDMRALLEEITTSQQTWLDTQLRAGAEKLREAQERIWISVVVALMLGLWMTLAFREAIAGPVVRLTQVAERIRSGHLEAQAEVEYKDEIGTLATAFNSMTGQLRETLSQVRQEKKRADDLLNVVIPIGVELSSEKDFNRLMENILLEAKTFCHAEGGILYLLRPEDDHLESVIVRNDARNIAMGGTTGIEVSTLPVPLHHLETGEPNTQDIAAHAVLSAEPINIQDIYKMENYDFSGWKKLAFDSQNGGSDGQQAISCLAIPLENNRQEIIGVLELLNARDAAHGQIIPFDFNLQQMMESFSSLAVAAVEAYIREEGLRQEIKKLRIEIDEVKRHEQVSQIVDTDFFQDLRSRAGDLRRRARRRSAKPDTDVEKDAPE